MSATKTQYENSYIEQLNRAVEQQALHQQERARRDHRQERQQTTIDYAKLITAVILTGASILALTSRPEAVPVALAAASVAGLMAWMRGR